MSFISDKMQKSPYASMKLGGLQTDLKMQNPASEETGCLVDDVGLEPATFRTSSEEVTLGKRYFSSAELQMS